MITKFVLNAILHHVGMLWIICSKKEIFYEIDKRNHTDWLNKGPWYNTYICSKLHGKIFGDFITHARTDRYNITCSIVAHDKKQPLYEDYERSIGDRPIPKNSTTKTLEALGATLNFIDIWLKLFDQNYDVRNEAYNIAMKKMLQKIPTIKPKPLSQGKKVQKLTTEICGGW